MTSYHDVIVRAIRVEQCHAEFVFMTDREHTEECDGTKHVDRMFCADAVVAGDGAANYRLVSRCVRDPHYGQSCYDRRSEYGVDDDGSILYSYMKPYMSRAYDGDTVTIMKYADNTFTAPMDMPLDDPIVHRMNYYFTRAARIRNPALWQG